MAKMDCVVALDTSDQYLTLVLKTPKGVFSYHKPVQMAAQKALNVLNNLCLEANVSLSDIGCFAVTIGPGRFAGIRSSIALIQGLAWGLGVKVVAIPTLSAWAQGAFDRLGVDRVWVCMDARMAQWAQQRFESAPQKGAANPILLSQEALVEEASLRKDKGWVVVGTALDHEVFGSGVFKGIEIRADFQLQPQDLLVCAAYLPMMDPLDLAPLYLRPAVV